MKNIAGTLILLIFAIKLSAQSYIPVDQNSKVTFTIKNFGFNVGGSFSGLKGSIRFDPAEINKAYFDVTVDANTINTDNNMRDNHLREESYFDVKNHPLIRFESTKITESNRKGTLFIFGKLTLKKQIIGYFLSIYSNTFRKRICI